MRTSTLGLLLLSLTCIAVPAQAARWQTVARQEGERVDIDKARIARVGEGQTLAWSRLVLNREMTVDGRSYNAVEALNRYDCSQHRFTTLKRVYLQGIEPVKEEAVGAARVMSADAGSVDEKLLGEACKPRTVGEMKQTAELARQAAAMSLLNTPNAPNALADEQSPARVMLADVRQLADTPQDAREKAARLRTVADTRTDAPHKIELPSKADLAARAAAEKAALIPAEVAPAKAVPSAHPAGSAASPAPSLPLPEVQPYRPGYRSISRGAPRAKPAVKADPAPLPDSHAVHWSYEGEGNPANWGKLRADYALCSSGQRQSPIDIRDGIQVDLEPLKLDYKQSLFRIVDNGHTVQASVGEGSTLNIMGRQYTLLQVHFHRPAEERVQGKVYDMVHKDLDGDLAVVAVLLEKGEENPLIQTLWNNLPLEVGQELTPDTPIDLNELLPEVTRRAYWTYMGSLTTPPCSENVLWMVMKQPMQVSPQQIAIFSRLYRNNARPIQPANNRLIKSAR